MIVYDKLWITMKDKGITKYALRDKHYIESNTIRRMMANKNTTTDTLNKLCKILDCRLEDIAEYIPD